MQDPTDLNKFKYYYNRLNILYYIHYFIVIMSSFEINDKDNIDESDNESKVLESCAKQVNPIVNSETIHTQDGSIVIPPIITQTQTSYTPVTSFNINGKFTQTPKIINICTNNDSQETE